MVPVKTLKPLLSSELGNRSNKKLMINKFQLMKTIFIAAMLLIASTTCNKEECYECHYDGPNGEVELEGEYCGEAAEDLENSGYVMDTMVYTVHCGEH